MTRIRSAIPLLSFTLTMGTGLGCGGDRFDWRTDAPEEQGLDPVAFHRWADSVQDRGTAALLVVRNDRVVHEWHREGRGPADRHYTASLAKGLFGGLALALLADEGRLSLEEPARAYVPAWREDDGRSRITVRHLASHTSGLEDAHEAGVPKEDLTGWKALFWDRDPVRTRFHLAVEEARLLFEPGTAVEYSNTGFAVLSYVLAKALQGAREDDVRRFLRDRLLRPIGVRDREWQMGYGEPFEVDGVRVWDTSGGGLITPRALARVGRLLLRRGDWEGRWILSAEAVEEVVTTRDPVPWRPGGGRGGGLPAPAAGWWTNENGVWPDAPRDAFAAVGAEHQVLLVVPSLDLVVVRMGRALVPDGEEGDGLFEPIGRHLVEPLMEAFRDPPAPRSDRIAGAWFDPPSAIVCEADGSDNWPVTWAEDGALYTAYGTAGGSSLGRTPSSASGTPASREAPGTSGA